MSTGQGRKANERLDAALRDLGIIRPQEHAAPANAGASRRPYTLARTCLFACKLAGSAVVGATITIVLGGHFHLWSSKRALAGQQSFQTAAAVNRSVHYRSPPRKERPRGWEAEAATFDADQPLHISHAVMTTGPATPAEQPVPPVSDPSSKFADLTPVLPPARSPLSTPMGALKLSEVRSWLYQLQEIRPARIANSTSDLVVIDPNGEDGPFTRLDVETMRRKPDGSRRILLSYLSIGEAESYRWYWPSQSVPWLGQRNPRWRDNYSVRFWHEGWQKIIFEYVDTIIAAGFDGVYLDKVDGYEEMGHEDEMVEFIARIAEHAKAKRPDFLVVSQNGDLLIPNPKFRAAIDAFAREDLLFGETTDGVPNGATSIRESVERLKMLTAEGKPVFVVEYPRSDEQAAAATREIAELGFVGLVAKRSLDAMDR